MAVDTVLEKNKSDASLVVDERNLITAVATREFTATVTDPVNDTILTVLASASIPQPNDVHPGSSYLICKDVKHKRISPILFEVIAEYESYKFEGEQGGTGIQNPLNRAAVFSYFTTTSDEPIDEDVNGAAIATANNELFTGVTKQVSDLAVKIQKNLITFVPSQFYVYQNKVNSDSFLGFPPGTARVIDIQAQQVTESNFGFWDVSVTVQFRQPYRTTTQRAWWKRIRHEGFMVRDFNDEIFRATDDKGDPVVQPVFLYENGQQIIGTGGLPFWKEFQVYETIAFSGMGLF